MKFAFSRSRIGPKTLLIGFIAGALAVVTFHQAMVWLCGNAELIPAGGTYSMRPVAPFAVPTILNQMFWGGLWGALYAAIQSRIPITNDAVKGVLFGWAGPLLVGWIVMPLIRNMPLFSAFVQPRMLANVLIAGSFGFGLAFIYRLIADRMGSRRLL